MRRFLGKRKYDFEICWDGSRQKEPTYGGAVCVFFKCGRVMIKCKTQIPGLFRAHLFNIWSETQIKQNYPETQKPDYVFFFLINNSIMLWFIRVMSWDVTKF